MSLPSAPPRLRGPGTKRRILLAMGFASHLRQAGITHFAREAGWIVDSRLLAFHAAGLDREFVRGARYDGILALCSRASPWMRRLIKRFHVPVVDMWADYPSDKYPRVLLDHAAIGRLAAEHLVARGFRELLFYTHAIERRIARQRERGFREVAEAAGARVQSLTWDHSAPPARGRPTRTEWLGRWLAAAPLPLGVMGSNDYIACEVIEAAQAAGLHVPRQVAVLGVDNDPLVTELAPVPLSSIDSARERAGYEAAALLERIMRGEPPPARPVLVPPGRVVSRRSTDALAVRNPDVAAALQHIQEHFRQPITVGDVVSGRNVSRRHLQDTFRADTGRTISQAITSHRLDYAQRMLLATRAKVELIAHQSGFGTGENMCKVFRRLVGLTPQAYREKYSRTVAGGLPSTPLSASTLTGADDA